MSWLSLSEFFGSASVNQNIFNDIAKLSSILTNNELKTLITAGTFIFLILKIASYVLKTESKFQTLGSLMLSKIALPYQRCGKLINYYTAIK